MITENGTDISTEPAEITPGQTNETIEETPIEELPPIGVSETVDFNENGTTCEEPSPQIETTIEDCEVLYGVVMETAHGMIGAKNGKGHRELPEDRRKAQGRLLHSICLKYGITIPTEFELVIFGGALIADWRYMTVLEDTTQAGGESIEIEEINDSDKE